MDSFNLTPTSHRTMNHGVDLRWLANSTLAHNHFSHSFWSSHEKLNLLSKRSVCLLLNDHIGPTLHPPPPQKKTATPKLHWLLKFQWLTLFCTKSILFQSFVILMFILICTLNHTPLKFKYMIKTNNQVKSTHLGSRSSWDP